MNQDALTVVIAESTRLGTHVLEKILEPYMQVRICRDDPALNAALAVPPSPRLCLISYLWPEIDMLLAQLSQHEPPVPAVLLASPDSDPEVLAQLTEQFQCSVLYRPYEPTQVIREVLSQFSKPMAAIPVASEQAVDSHEPEPVAPEPEEQDGPDQSLGILARDQAFCRRHRLPHSVMVLRIQDLENLRLELGEQICEDARSQLVDALDSRLRQEDGLVITDFDQLLLTLPGTPPLGARVLAHRLCAWLQREEFRVQDFRIHFTIAVGIHCLTGEGDETPEESLQLAHEAALVAHANHQTSAVHLSDAASEQAMHHIHREEESADADETETVQEPAPEPAAVATEPDPETLWESVQAVLTSADPETAGTARTDVLNRLTATLRLLSENERLALVDELLLASALPET